MNPFRLSSFRQVTFTLSLAGVVACAGAQESRPVAPATPSSTPAPSASAALSPSAAKADAYPDDANITKATQEYLDLLVDIHPEDATSLGLHQHDGELEDRTIAGEDKAMEREEALLKSFEKRFENAKVSKSGKTDLAILLGALRVDIRRTRVQRPLQRKPDTYLDGPMNAIFQMTARDYAPAPERAKNMLSRLDKIPAQIDAAKAQLLNPPKVWTEIAIDKAGSGKGFFADQRAFLVGALPSDTAKIDASLKKATAAYEDYKAFLQKTVLPKSNGRFSAGKELFEYLLKNDYALDEGSDELLAMGKKIFAETNAQMSEVAKRIDPKAKNWAEVTAKLKAKHPAADDLLEAYKKEVARARAYIVEKDAVALPPGDQLDVIDTPPFMRSTTTAAYDQPPPFDQKVTKGLFFVTPVDKTLSKAKQEEMLRENDYADMVNTSVHEAYPGHHLQLSFARRSPSLVRRALDHAILSEGWALYCEELMAELGYYDDAQRLMQLEWTLVRAARVIIDVGLHAGDMTFEQGVKLLTDEVHLEKQLALSEVKRYTEDPTQPSAYILGRQLIFKLRERAKQRDGAKFTLKAFHTDLLSRGTVPPPLLAHEMFD